MNKDAFNKGLKTRREVLGAEYVDTAIKNADDFNMPMQELVTEYCWNEVWNRPGLERKTRSFLNLAMIAALNRPHELFNLCRFKAVDVCQKDFRVAPKCDLERDLINPLPEGRILAWTCHKSEFGTFACGEFTDFRIRLAICCYDQPFFTALRCA